MIEIRQLTFRYQKKPLFQNLHLELAPGNLYGLLGRNGAGKTTLLKLCCGLLLPQEGEIRVFGQDPARRRPGLLADLFLVPEEFQLPPVSAKLYCDMLAPFYPNFSRERFLSYLHEFEMEEAGHLGQLSMGQKKKFLLAFGLATGVRFLMLDEPTNGLDIPAKGQFRKILAAESGADRIILVSTHQVRDMEHLIDPLVILDAGRILFSSSIEDFSARFSFLQGELPPGVRVVHEERALGRTLSLAEGVFPEALPPDLELLFNAVTAHPEIFEQKSDKQEARHA